MAFALVAFSGLFFALWRRSFGGWLGGGKVVKHAIAGAILAVLGLLLAKPPLLWLAVFAASIPHWQFGHELDGPIWKTTVRYSTAPMVLAFAAGMAGFWGAVIPLALIGPASAAGCWIVLRPGFIRWSNQFLGRPVKLFDWHTDFIDGHLCFAEMGLGLSWGLGVAVAMALA